MPRFRSQEKLPYLLIDCLLQPGVSLQFGEICNLINPIMHMIHSLPLYPLQRIISQHILHCPQVDLALLRTYFLPQFLDIHQPILSSIVAQGRLTSN